MANLPGRADPLGVRRPHGSGDKGSLEVQVVVESIHLHVPFSRLRQAVDAQAVLILV